MKKQRLRANVICACGFSGLSLLMSGCSSLPNRATGPIGRSEQGIWKAAVPGQVMHGEFADLDPMGLIANARIPSDCSINWSNPDTGKLYCFVSATSLVYFLQAPQERIEAAGHAWLLGTAQKAQTNSN